MKIISIGPKIPFFFISLKENSKDYFRYCVPYLKKKTYSTSRDVAITCDFYKEKHLPLNIFSIRQSGCQATIVVICDETIKFSNLAIKMINCINAHVIRTKIPESFRHFHTDLIRDNFVLDFAKRYQSDYDRIFFFDAFDVFFEKDIFKYFTEKKLYFFKESPTKIKWSRSNRKWIQNCYGRLVLRDVRNACVVCSGTIASGSLLEFIKFFSLLINFNNWEKCVVDQGTLNYLIHEGILKRHNISYHVFDFTSPIQTCYHFLDQIYFLHIRCDPYSIYSNYFGNPDYLHISTKENITAPVIHQWTRIKKFIDSFYKRTHMKSFLHVCQSRSDKIENFVNTSLFIELPKPRKINDYLL